MINQPQPLRAGDKVAIVAPAGKLVEGTLEIALSTFKKWGLTVIIGEHVEKGYNYFSASDADRISDFQKALNSQEIKAIFCARGGYGTTRIIDQLDFKPFLSSPKWLVGFSDITTIHFVLHNLGLQSIHATMPTGFRNADERSIESLRRVLFGENITYEVSRHHMNRTGTAKAPIIGGNLSIINDSLGTLSEIEFDGKILFIEEIDEYLYKLDRMMVQLKRAQKLEKLAGLIVGNMTAMKDSNVPFGKEAFEIIHEHTAGFTYPIAFGLPIGHGPLNYAIPCSALCTLEVKGSGTNLSFN